MRTEHVFLFWFFHVIQLLTEGSGQGLEFDMTYDLQEVPRLPRFVKQAGSSPGATVTKKPVALIPPRIVAATKKPLAAIPPRIVATTKKPPAPTRAPAPPPPPPRRRPYSIAFAVGGRGLALGDSGNGNPEESAIMGRSMSKPLASPGSKLIDPLLGDDTDGAVLSIGLETAAMLCGMEAEFEATKVPPKSKKPGSKYLDKFKVKPNQECHHFRWIPCLKRGTLGNPCGCYEFAKC